LRRILLLLALAACSDRDRDGYDRPGDCDDRDELTYPGAAELCDGLDNDCDGAIDEDTTTWHPDADLDGYGDRRGGVTTCAAPSGYVADGTDCNDDDGDVYPGAFERCNASDDDCDGRPDDGVSSTWYPDEDGDGFGSCRTRTR
jgi:hypothetical protein